MGEFKSRGYLSINECVDTTTTLLLICGLIQRQKNKEHHAKYKINIIASLNFLKRNILIIIEAEVTERIHTLSFRFSFDIVYCDIYKNHENEIEQKLSGLGFLVNQKKSQVAPSSTTIQRLGFLINKEIHQTTLKLTALASFIGKALIPFLVVLLARLHIRQLIEQRIAMEPLTLIR
ncbi:hypothetical protein BD770DRAFT_432009 [Pilaira anomala]|nr:hypothetical protein BD770DRAFT_432009 [Pilaira anomala]